LSEDFFRNFVAELDDEDTSVASDGLGAAEYGACIDTGSYILNALLSGSLYGGVPNNKITAFAGESSTGKTFFVLGIVKHYLKNNPTAGVMYFDTEAAVTKKMMEDRGIDTRRVIISEPDTIEKFRHKAITALDKYAAADKDTRPPLLMVLDSLGMLSSNKEIGDTSAGKDTRDMTKPGLLRATFRTLTLKCAKAQVPMLVTNHVYAVIGSYVPMNEMSGGGGLKFAASIIVGLSKKKDKDGTEIVGNLIRCRCMKSRVSKENAEVQARLSYDSGLDRYYGLVELGEKYGVFKKVATRYELPNGTKLYAKAMLENPEKYFTADIMARLEEAAKKEFSYGTEEEGDGNEDSSTLAV